MNETFPGTNKEENNRFVQLMRMHPMERTEAEEREFDRLWELIFAPLLF